MAPVAAVAAETIAKYAAKFGKQVGKTSNKGIAAFGESVGYSDRALTLVNVNTGKVVGTQFIESKFKGGLGLEKVYSRKDAAGCLLSEGKISAPDYAADPTKVGFPIGNLYYKPMYAKGDLRAQKLQNEYVRYNRFGQVVHQSKNTLDLNPFRPELTITSKVNGIESSRVIDTSSKAFLG